MATVGVKELNLLIFVGKQTIYIVYTFYSDSCENRYTAVCTFAYLASMHLLRRVPRPGTNCRCTHERTLERVNLFKTALKKTHLHSVH